MNSRKILVTIFVMILYSFVGFAQNVKASLGITGGGVATLMFGVHPTPVSPMYISGYGGAVTTVNFGDHIGLRGEINYTMQGSKYELSEVGLTAKQSYLNIPLAFMYNIKSFVSVEAGFFQNILLSSSIIEKGVEEIVVSPDEGALKYNLGILAGFSFNVGRYIFVNVRYNYGLSSSYVIYGTGYPSSSVTLGVGFNLISTKKTVF